MKLFLFFIIGTNVFCHTRIFFETSFLLNMQKSKENSIIMNLYLDEMNTLVLLNDFSTKK